MSVKCGICVHAEHPGRRCSSPVTANVGDHAYRRIEIVDRCGCETPDELQYRGRTSGSRFAPDSGDTDPDAPNAPRGAQTAKTTQGDA